MFASSTCTLISDTVSQCIYQGFSDVIFGLAIIIFIIAILLWEFILKQFGGGKDFEPHL